MQRLIDADALYNGAMKDEYFSFVARDNHGRESFAYSCAMQRLADATTIDAIPVEWLNKQCEMADDRGDMEMTDAISWLIQTWHEEQEAQDG